MTERLPGDQGAVWRAVRRGDLDTAAAIVGRQDTAELARWRRDAADGRPEGAARFLEAIADELETRQGIDNYPRHGMRTDEQIELNILHDFPVGPAYKEYRDREVEEWGGP